MKLLFILFFPVVSWAQNLDDSTGWVQPWLNSQTGVIQGMNTNLLSMPPGTPDTLFLAMEVSYPTRPGIIVRVPGDTQLVHRVLLEINGFAVKQRSQALGQHWHMYDELRRPIEFLLGRGVRIWKIQVVRSK